MFTAVMKSKRPDVPAAGELPGAPGYCLAGYKKLMADCWHQVCGWGGGWVGWGGWVGVRVCVCARTRRARVASSVW